MSVRAQPWNAERQRSPNVALSIAALLLLAIIVWRAAESWSNDSHLDHVAGVWIAQAVDLANGTFYRAPYGPYGYGGGRHFPLFFCLHALAIKVFGQWRATGYALSTASIVLLLAGVYYLLRRIGASRWLSVGGCLAVIAGSSVQYALLTIREDAMAAMLNVWGVALCTGADSSRLRPYYAAALFTLAFATKETTVFGLVAGFLALLLTGRTQRALRLLMFTSVGYAFVLVGTFLGSGGRALEVFRLTATVGMDLRSLFFSASKLVYTMRGDIGETIVIALGVAILLTGKAASLRRIPSLLFLCTLAVTLVIFSSEGIADNHLIDLHVAATVLLMDWVLQIGLPKFGLSITAVACFIVFLSLMAEVDEGSGDTIPNRAQMEKVIRVIGTPQQPILAETPLLPILAGQRPYLLDPFGFRIMIEKRFPRRPDVADA